MANNYQGIESMDGTKRGQESKCFFDMIAFLKGYEQREGSESAFSSKSWYQEMLGDALSREIASGEEQFRHWPSTPLIMKQTSLKREEKLGETRDDSESKLRDSSELVSDSGDEVAPFSSRKFFKPQGKTHFTKEGSSLEEPISAVSTARYSGSYIAKFSEQAELTATIDSFDDEESRDSLAQCLSTLTIKEHPWGSDQVKLKQDHIETTPLQSLNGGRKRLRKDTPAKRSCLT